MQIRFIELVELWLFGVAFGAATVRFLWARTLGNYWSVTNEK